MPFIKEHHLFGVLLVTRNYPILFWNKSAKFILIIFNSIKNCCIGFLKLLLFMLDLLFSVAGQYGRQKNGKLIVRVSGLFFNVILLYLFFDMHPVY